MLGPVGNAARLVVRGLLELLYPNVCWACGAPLPAGRAGFCAPCHEALTTEPLPTCPRCAATVGPYVHLADGCTHCRGANFAFDQAVRLGTYDGLLRELILRLKHHSGEGLAEVLADFWAG